MLMPLGAQRLGDARDHARPVGHVDAHAVQILGRGRVGGVQQAPAVAGRVGDPAGDVAGILALQRPRQVVQPAAVLAQPVQQRLAVVQEDVDPDPRVGAGDAGHVAERPADGGQRVMAVHAPGAGLVDQRVGDGVRQVAGQRDQPVVRVRVDRHRPGAQRRHEGVQPPVALGIGRGHRRQEIGRAGEQVAAGVGDAAGLGAAHRMAADRTGGRRRRPPPAVPWSSRRRRRRSPPERRPAPPSPAPAARRPGRTQTPARRRPAPRARPSRSPTRRPARGRRRRPPGRCRIRQHR